jgi:hypothetical protein
MKTFLLIASGLICLFSCTFEVDVNHKGVPKTFDHEIHAPGLLAPQPKDAGADDSADSAE